MDQPIPQQAELHGNGRRCAWERPAGGPRDSPPRVQGPVPLRPLQTVAVTDALTATTGGRRSAKADGACTRQACTARLPSRAIPCRIRDARGAGKGCSGSSGGSSSSSSRNGRGSGDVWTEDAEGGGCPYWRRRCQALCLLRPQQEWRACCSCAGHPHLCSLSPHCCCHCWRWHGPWGCGCCCCCCYKYCCGCCRCTSWRWCWHGYRWWCRHAAFLPALFSHAVSSACSGERAGGAWDATTIARCSQGSPRHGQGRG